MAFSFTDRTGDGVTTAFTFGLTGPDNGYIRDEDISVEVGGTPVSFTLTGPNSVELDVAPADQALVRIIRTMPTDAPYSDFTRGNAFGQRNINNSLLQQLYLFHSLSDGFKEDDYYEKQDLNLGENRAVNSADPVGDQDLTTKSYVDNLTDPGRVEEAKNWANYPEDQLVPEGDLVDDYSALHHAAKADDSAAVASQAASDALASENAAAGYAAQALSAGNPRKEIYVSGVDFTPAITTSLSFPGVASDDELVFTVAFDGITQHNEPASAVINGVNTDLTLTAAIPSDVTEVYIHTNYNYSITDIEDAEAAAEAAALTATTQAGIATTQAGNASIDAAAAAVSETNAGNSATEAEHWANYPEDQAVPEGTGEFSAKHYAQKVADTINNAGIGSFFELDASQDLMPAVNPIFNDDFELDGSGNIQPRA